MSGVEVATKISELVATNPPGSDPKSEGDNHLRLIKGVLQDVFDDSGTTLKTTLPIESPAGAVFAGDVTIGTINGKPIAQVTARTRNRITNPTAQIGQENGTTAVTGAGGYAADQWATYFSGITASGQRGTSKVSPEGTPWAVTLTATTAKASLAAGDYVTAILPVEGLDIADFEWGTASAKPVVLRFNVFCEQAGTFPFCIRNGGSARSYLGSYTVAANTWKTVSVAIPGDITGTWPKDTSHALDVIFSYAAGSNYVSPGLGWNAGNFFAPPGMTNGAGVANAKLWLTDVGLYLDRDSIGVAPPFSPPGYGDELVRCKRYWQQIWAGFSGNVTSASQYLSTGAIPVQMRVGPSMSASNPVGVGFPAAAGTANLGSFNQMYETRTANGTGSATYSATWTMSARLI